MQYLKWLLRVVFKNRINMHQRGIDSALLWKWNVYFPLRRRQRNGGERKSLGWPDAGSDAADASSQFNRQTRGAKCEGMWSEHPITCGTGASGHASRRAARGEGLIGRGARPVSHDRTSPVDEVSFWTLAGLKPDAGCNASGQSRSDTSSQQSRSLEPLWTATGRWHYRVRSWRGAHPVTLYLRA
jgi:hypothetical protein